MTAHCVRVVHWGTPVEEEEAVEAAVAVVVEGPARAVLETRCALGPVAVAPLAHRLVVDLEPLSDGGHAPAFLDDESDHLEPMRRGERRVGVLGPSNL